jgi:minor histocompatibility antigen H13
MPHRLAEPCDDGMTETNYLLYFSYATIVSIWIISQLVIIPYVVHLIVLVTAIIYAASHHSIVLLRTDEAAAGEGKGTSTAEKVETLKQEDAYQFPILGAISLCSLYLAFKFLDKDLVNLLIGLYFCTVGCMAIYATISSAFPAVGPRYSVKRSISHPLPKFIMESPLEISVSMTLSQIFLLIASAIFCYFYLQKKHWSMNNVLGICFCLQGIERFSLGTFQTGAILLVGLFFYDIFFVFGTDVMVTVAKSLDGYV